MNKYSHSLYDDDLKPHKYNEDCSCSDCSDKREEDEDWEPEGLLDWILLIGGMCIYYLWFIYGGIVIVRSVLEVL